MIVKRTEKKISLFISFGCINRMVCECAATATATSLKLIKAGSRFLLFTMLLLLYMCFVCFVFPIVQKVENALLWMNNAIYGKETANVK